MSTGNPTQAVPLTREAQLEVHLQKILNLFDRRTHGARIGLEEDAYKAACHFLAEPDRRGAIPTGVVEGETLRTARESWWRELTKTGDPARRTNLAFEAFEAGFQAAFRMTESEANLQRERDEALARGRREGREEAARVVDLAMNMSPPTKGDATLVAVREGTIILLGKIAARIRSSSPDSGKQETEGQ